MLSGPLISDLLRSDPRVVEARRLLQDALAEHRERITAPKPPAVERQEDYAQLIQVFSRNRGGDLFFPYLGSGIGNGALVELADGSIKYDMITGIGVHVFGHSDPRLLDAGIDAALQDTVMQGNLQQGIDSTQLCEEFLKIVRGALCPLAHCFLSTSGATANENALKILFQHQYPADRMLSFANGFSGRTLATAQLTDRAKNRVGLPTVMAVDYVPFFDRNAPDSLQRSLNRLEEHLERYPGQYAGMIMELIQGEGGYYTAPREFFMAICETLRRHDVPIWFDEIQTFGRTTKPFAFQHLRLDQYADVVTVGKMTQVCATLFRDELTPKPGLISQTFTGATSSILASLAILKELQSGDYFGSRGRLMQVHERFASHFEEIHTAVPEWISGPWGYGGMVAFQVFDGSASITKIVLDRLYHAGVLAFSAGANPTRVRMLPPFTVITDDQIDHVCGILQDVLQSVGDTANRSATSRD